MLNRRKIEKYNTNKKGVQFGVNLFLYYAFAMIKRNVIKIDEWSGWLK
jgi:hypothetical protein